MTKHKNFLGGGMENIFQIHLFQGTILISQELAHCRPMRKSSRLSLLSAKAGFADVSFLFLLNNTVAVSAPFWSGQHLLRASSANWYSPKPRERMSLLTREAFHSPLLRGLPPRVNGADQLYLKTATSLSPPWTRKRGSFMLTDQKTMWAGFHLQSALQGVCNLE